MLPPPIDTLVRIADALGLSLSAVLKRAGALTSRRIARFLSSIKRSDSDGGVNKPGEHEIARDFSTFWKQGGFLQRIYGCNDESPTHSVAAGSIRTFPYFLNWLVISLLFFCLTAPLITFGDRIHSIRGFRGIASTPITVPLCVNTSHRSVQHPETGEVVVFQIVSTCSQFTGQQQLGQHHR